MLTFETIINKVDRIEYVKYQNNWYYNYRVIYDYFTKSINFTISYQGLFILVPLSDITEYRLDASV